MLRIKLCDPILQKGPTCGFVVLAYNGIHSLEEWITRGKSTNITKSGELFNIYVLCDFANSNGLNTLVETWNTFTIIQHLSRGELIGVAYDSGKDHFPFNGHGSCAHWGLIHGYTFTKSSKYTLDNDMKSHNHIPVTMTYFQENQESLSLLVRQGKSKYSRWIPFQVLKDSNQNLEKAKELDPEYYLIPSSLKSSLANLILVFNP